MASVSLRNISSWVDTPRHSGGLRRKPSLFSRSAAEKWDLVEGGNAPIITWSTGTSPRAFAFTALRDLDQDDTLLNALGYIIWQKLLGVDCVKAAYFDFDEEQTTISVWTILDTANEANRRTVYEKELELIDEFPHVVFNFRTTDSQGEETPASSSYRYLAK